MKRLDNLVVILIFLLSILLLLSLRLCVFLPPGKGSFWTKLLLGYSGNKFLFIFQRFLSPKLTFFQMAFSYMLATALTELILTIYLPYDINVACYR